jgi:16S rRNA (guanine1516-N2)-methyltransferase
MPIPTAILPEPVNAPALLTRAEQLATTLALPVVSPEKAQGFELLLVVTPRRLELRWTDPAAQPSGHRPRKPNTGQAIAPDWDTLRTASGPGGSMKQPIVKAIGIKPSATEPLRVIDAAAGWGQDAWIMASLGCRVTMIERHPLIAALLADALEQQRLLSPVTVSRMRLIQGQAIDLLSGYTADNADVIHLDPMFPDPDHLTQRKPMRLLARLAGDDADAPDLLATAMATGVERIVVKRPPHAPPLGDRAPEHVIHSKASRYDVYLR